MVLILLNLLTFREQFIKNTQIFQKIIWSYPERPAKEVFIIWCAWVKEIFWNLKCGFWKLFTEIHKDIQEKFSYQRDMSIVSYHWNLHDASLRVSDKSFIILPAQLKKIKRSLLNIHMTPAGSYVFYFIVSNWWFMVDEYNCILLSDGCIDMRPRWGRIYYVTLFYKHVTPPESEFWFKFIC